MSKLSKITLLLLKVGTLPISQLNISSHDRTSVEDLNYINIRGSFKKYVDNVAVERKKFLQIKFNTWKDSKSYILSTMDVSIN